MGWVQARPAWRLLQAFRARMPLRRRQDWASQGSPDSLWKGQKRGFVFVRHSAERTNLRRASLGENDNFYQLGEAVSTSQITKARKVDSQLKDYVGGLCAMIRSGRINHE